MNKYTKTVKVLKQGAVSVTIPQTICKLLNLTPGDLVTWELDLQTCALQLRKEDKDET